ncbi:hypothetical protein BH10BAC3_BH10BAC3_28940 [soil metagenome]
MDNHYPPILRQWLGGERDWGYENDDSTTKKAASICGASQVASEAAKGTEPIGREERARYFKQVTHFEEECK